MSPSIDREASILGLIRHLWMGRLIRSLAMAMIVLVFAANVSSELTEAPSSVIAKAGTPAPEQPQVVTSPLPLPGQAKAVFRSQWMTEAAMTSHNLTAAHFFSRRATKKLSAEPQELAKQG